MKIKRLFSLIAYFTVCSINLFGQTNFLDGYIITNNGDTVRGKIDYRNWAINPQTILFCEATSNTQTSYSPDNIKEFGVADEIYVSAEVEVETSPHVASEVNFKSDFQFTKLKAFLQTLYKGKKSLYLLNTRLWKEQYYIYNDSSYQLLLHKKYKKEFNQHSNSSFNVVEVKRYLNQLAKYLDDCSEINSKLPNTKYTKGSIMNLFEEYYTCTNTTANFSRENEKSKIIWGIQAGATNTIISFQSEQFDYLVYANFKNSTRPTLGVFIDIIFPRLQERFSIANSLIVTTFNVKGTYNYYESEFYSTETFTELGYTYIKLQNLFRYSFPIKNHQIFINVGVTNGIALFGTNTKKKITRNYSSEYVEKTIALDSPRVHELGYIGGMGYRISKFSFEFRFEKSSGLSVYTNLVSPVNRYYFLASYTL